MWVKKQQLEPWMEQLIDSRLRKEYDRVLCYHPIGLIYMLNTSWEMPTGWVTSWNQDRLEKHQQSQYVNNTTVMAKNKGELKNHLMRVKEESERAGLKLNIKTKIMTSGPIQFSSVQFSHSVGSYSLRPHELQHARPPCPSPTPGVHSNSHPSSQWCHWAISSSVVPFSSCPQSLPVLESFPMSQLFAWGGQSIGVSALASVLQINTQTDLL